MAEILPEIWKRIRVETESSDQEKRDAVEQYVTLAKSLPTRTRASPACRALAWGRRFILRGNELEDFLKEPSREGRLSPVR